MAEVTRTELVNRIIAMYHTTRLLETPASVHVLSKPYVSGAFDDLEQAALLKGIRLGLEAAAAAADAKSPSGTGSEFDVGLACGVGAAVDAIRALDPNTIAALKETSHDA